MDHVDWNQLRAFLETAQTGSLSAAARKLGLTQPTLSRQVAAVEQRMGVTLFERVGKSMSLTPTGQDLLEHARAMGAAAEALGLAATGRSEAAEGVVSVSACDVVATLVLPPILRQLREQAPGIAIEVIASDAVSDLLRREADIAIRHVQPEQPELIARLVRKTTACFYASEDFVRTHGHPRTASEALHMPFIGGDRVGRYLSNLQQHGLALTQANFSCYAADSLANYELMRKGLGIGAMLVDVAQNTPGVVRVLEAVPTVTIPIWLVTHRELRTARRIRIVFDALARALAAT